MVLYMVLSDTLADRSMARRQQVCWKGCFTVTYFYWDFSGLLQVGLFLVAVHVIFPFFFCLWEGASISSKKVPKVRKNFIHTGRQTKNDTEDESNLQTHACKQMKTTCHTCLQASLHKHKTAGNKERQQENEESGQKIPMNLVARTAGWRSTLSNGAHQRKPTKTKQMQRPFFNKLRIKAKEN